MCGCACERDRESYVMEITFVVFHIEHFEPQAKTCVIEGFSVLEMHLLFLL